MGFAFPFPSRLRSGFLCTPTISGLCAEKFSCDTTVRASLSWHTNARRSRPRSRKALHFAAASVVSSPARKIGVRRRLHLHGRTLPMPRQGWQCPHGESVRTPHEDGGNSWSRGLPWSCSRCDFARNFAGKQWCHWCGEPRGRHQESLTSANQRASSSGGAQHQSSGDAAVWTDAEGIVAQRAHSPSSKRKRTRLLWRREIELGFDVAGSHFTPERALRH